MSLLAHRTVFNSFPSTQLGEGAPPTLLEVALEVELALLVGGLDRLDLTLAQGIQDGALLLLPLLEDALLLVLVVRLELGVEPLSSLRLAQAQVLGRVSSGKRMRGNARKMGRTISSFSFLRSSFSASNCFMYSGTAPWAASLALPVITMVPPPE